MMLAVTESSDSDNDDELASNPDNTFRKFCPVMENTTPEGSNVHGEQNETCLNRIVLSPLNSPIFSMSMVNDVTRIREYPTSTMLDE